MGMNDCHIKAEQATTNNIDEPCTMSSFPSSFDETDVMFLEFAKDLNNPTGWSSSVDDNSDESNEPISPHVVRFSQAIGVCVRKTFPVHCLRWANIGGEYIEVIKGDLQCFFVLDFKDQAMNRSNHETTRLLDRSNLTIIAAGQSRFYNENTSSLSNENQMLELQSQPTPDGFQPHSRDEICKTMLGRHQGFSKS
ncbi:CACTA en-spm transposon protein [Cucumis melo var. makuwa]|uniref:CACTA en-spm transposon protein n=1 Tax=Cucumis melo var. makuwa TaxID=1194695 RepID=A0A5D3DEC9_CUCMM|nr:CACTA en-spm transposon protein [Cucumis melo var. makuwa]TYK22041.1 CACTA en-spm transposon protein [Cucumis melo var. makuwa]